MRIYTNGRPKGHRNTGHPFIDIEETGHGYTILFSDPDGYYISRREEITRDEILDILDSKFSWRPQK